MKPEYQPYSPQEDAIIMSVYDSVYIYQRDNAALASQRIKEELGIVRSSGAVNSRKKRIEQHLKYFGRVIYQ